MFEAPDVPGAKELIEWFGYWPTFHDAEVLSISLDRQRGCQVSIRVFECTPRTDDGGNHVLAKHAVVTFALEGFPADAQGLSMVRIESFNHQNVLSSARVNKRPEGYELVLDGCYGVDASILSERMRIIMEPEESPGGVS